MKMEQAPPNARFSSKETKTNLFQGESEVLSSARRWILITLGLVGVLLSTSSYLVLDGQQKIQGSWKQELLEEQVEDALYALGILATEIQASLPDSAWPLVTLESWSSRVQPILSLGQFSCLLFIPVVPRETQWAFELYASRQSDWDLPDDVAEISIGSIGTNATFFPIWQMMPVTERSDVFLYNLDGSPAVAPAIHEALRTKTTTFGESFNENSSDPFESYVRDHSSGPVVPLVHPIVENDKVVGMVVGLRSWSQGQDAIYSTRSTSGGDIKDTIDNLDMAFAGLLLATFAFLFATAVLYNRMVERRQQLVHLRAVQSSALVSSLFPAAVADRLIQGPTAENTQGSDSSETSTGFIKEPAKNRLKTMIKDTSNHETDSDLVDMKPIADFFPNCTVLFADIVGFTAWSSEREPTQVFTLLQNVYKVFDKIARKRGVFKVETIGDSYVCVTGLPEPTDDHAVAMARFAFECRAKMKEVTRKLQRTLGPETDSLEMRFGLHSGPVTAGVLRGERARFQLFGDTVNTASRMESTGLRNQIHISDSTAELLRQAGKERWLENREGDVIVKGKGHMKTYWLKDSSMMTPRTSSQSSMNSFYSWTSSNDEVQASHDPPTIPRRRAMMSSMARDSVVWGKSQEFSQLMDTDPPELLRQESTKVSRLIDWNVGLLTDVLKQIMARKQIAQANDESTDALPAIDSKGHAIDEVAEVIALPSFEAKAYTGNQVDPSSISLDEDAEEQLRAFITAIAAMYRDNPFHNYEHACHVQMSMHKLLQRIVRPENISYDGECADIASEAHNYTYGITSDPLTQFAVLFCALIHDVDHNGVPNGVLIKENSYVAAHYKNKSVAEQNSIDLGWDLLMDKNYEDLRKILYSTKSELKRFRQLVVNVVLATDIFDKELSALRKSRWNKAFSPENKEIEGTVDDSNRKATIVIEHLIQASDVAHTMQHWDIYCKWNERLFEEMSIAFQEGRADKDPALGWYNGELWFFDNYVIPLARKLKECAVFGVSSEECLNYALDNRAIWEVDGKEFVDQMVRRREERMANQAVRIPTKRSKLGSLIEDDE